MNRTKRILFIGYNFSPELTGIGKYSGEMMHWLAEKGYTCTVLTGYPYYPNWRVQEPYRKNRFLYKKEVKQFTSGGRLVVIRCPMYIPGKPNTLKRMILDFSFFATVLMVIVPLIFSKKFDWVISVAPSFQFGLLGVLYKRIKGARHLYHIQDLQIEAAHELGLFKTDKLLKAFYSVENYIFKHTDIISSISEGMIRRIEKKTFQPVKLFPNWTDISNFHPITPNTPLKKKFGFKESDWIVLYSGALGEKQGIESILIAAKELATFSDLKFIVCGNGPFKERLKGLAVQLKLDNLFFLPLQPKEIFNEFLNMADLHLVLQKEKASDLVMPSKLTTILAIGGLSLTTANSDSSLHKLIDKFKMGLLVPAENQEALIEAIQDAFQDRNSGKYRSLRESARSYAIKYLCKERVMETFENQLDT